jgi:hypothetical protein
MKRKNTFKKLEKSSQVLGILNNGLKQTLVEKVLRIKVYNALAVPTLLDGIEIWTLRGKDKKTTDIHLDEIFQKFSRVHPF